MEQRVTRGDFLKRGLGGIVVVSGLGPALSACGDDGPRASNEAAGTAGEPPSRPTGRLRYGYRLEPTSLDPSKDSDANVTPQIYDSLIRWKPDYSGFEPGLATSWEVNDDGREWVLRLREGVTFHDGEALHSAAVKRSFDYYVNTPGSIWAGFLGEFEVDASDPLVVRVTYKEPYPAFARNQTIIKILSPRLLSGSIEAASRRVAQKPVGAGPFRFVRYRRGEGVFMEAFEDYWDDGPYVEQLEYRIIREASSRISALLAGDVDVISKVTPPQMRQLGTDTRRVRVATADTWTVQMLSISANVPPTDDVHVRQAVAHAIDRQALLDSVMLGQGVVQDGIVPRGAYGYVEASTEYPFDPEKARGLLRAAGDDGAVPVRMTVYAGNSVLGEQVGQAIAAMLDEAGFETEFDVTEAGVGQADLVAERRKYQIHLGDYGSINGDPLHVPFTTLRTRYEGKDLTDAVARVNTTPDGPERLEAIRDAVETIQRQALELTLYRLKLSDAFNADLQGYTAPVDGFTPVFRRAYWLR